MAAAKQALAAEDPSGFLEPLKLKYRDLQAKIRKAESGMSAASRAVRVLPGMLGADGPKKYLFVFQNNAELRSTGGLLGAVSVVDAVDGKLEIVRQVAGTELGRADKPVLPLTEAEVNTYDEILGTYFVNANMQPDWGRASDLMAARWRQVYDEKIDGVLSIDPVALSYVLKVTGPISIGNEKLTSDNLVSQLLHETYLTYPDPRDQDEYFRQVAAGAFERFTGDGVSARQLLPALRQGADERRILIHLFDEAQQQVLAGAPIAGEVIGISDDEVEPSTSPQIGVYINEGSASKMSYYLRTKLRVRATSCVNGVQTYSARLTVTNTASAAEVAALPGYISGNGNGTEVGTMVPIIQIYGPVDGRVSEINVTSAPQAFQVPISGIRRPLRQLWLSVKPGETQDVSWTMESGQDQPGDTRLEVTPNTTSGSDAADIRSAC